MFIFERPLPKYGGRVLKVWTYDPNDQRDRKAVDALISQGVGEIRREDSAKNRQVMVDVAPTNILVATIDQEVVGVTYLMHCRIWAHFWHFIVSDQYQGKGIGGVFLDIVLSYLLRQGLVRADFVIRDATPAAIALFKKAGFEPADNYTLMWYIEPNTPPSS